MRNDSHFCYLSCHMIHRTGISIKEKIQKLYGGYKTTKFTDDENQELKDLIERKYSFKYIGEHLNRYNVEGQYVDNIIKKPKRLGWHAEDDKLIMSSINNSNDSSDIDWQSIDTAVGRTPDRCKQRWKHTLSWKHKADSNMKPWSEQETIKWLSYLNMCGAKDFKTVN